MNMFTTHDPAPFTAETGCAKQQIERAETDAQQGRIPLAAMIDSAKCVLEAGHRYADNLITNLEGAGAVEERITPTPEAFEEAVCINYELASSLVRKLERIHGVLFGKLE